MKPNKQLTILAMVFIILSCSMYSLRRTPIKTFTSPVNWPKPHYDFDKNPLSPEKIALGRSLFYDPILSADSTISCASCHLSYTAFTHVDHALSHGIQDRIGTRNSPVLINLAWSKHFMWDGAINNLEVQALAPITHPAEMGEDLSHVLSKLRRHPSYPKRFFEVYNDNSISSSQLLKVLAQFQLTFVSANAKFDRVQQGLEQFSAQEEQGHQLFQQNCATCHPAPLFTTGNFSKNGLPMNSLLKDYGRFNITQNPADSFLFKIPTLRNIAFSKPYMHDGRFKTLKEVLNHYADNAALNLLLKSLSKHDVRLSSSNQVDLIAFLLTLTDKEFLFNRDLAFPINY